MSYLGSWKIDDNLTFTVVTHTPATGAVTDADSPPTYRIYEDETSAAILNGSMAKLDDANTTGHYSEQIALSAGNGLEKGRSYNIYIEATVGGIAGSTTKSFQIEAEVDANVVSDSQLSDILALLDNRMAINKATSELWLYNVAGDTVIKKWPLTDKDGSAIVLQGTGPANRGIQSL